MLIHYKRHLKIANSSSEKFSISSDDCTQFQSNSGNDYNFNSINGHFSSKDFGNLKVETPICINIVKLPALDSFLQDEEMNEKECNIIFSNQESHEFLFDNIDDDADEFIFEVN